MRAAGKPRERQPPTRFRRRLISTSALCGGEKKQAEFSRAHSGELGLCEPVGRSNGYCRFTYTVLFGNEGSGTIAKCP